MESLSAGLRGLGSMVARAATSAAGGAGGRDDTGPRPFALGPAGMLAAEWTHAGLHLWLIGADGTVEASHSVAGVGVGELDAGSSQGQALRFESVFERHVRILEQQVGSSDSHAKGSLRPALVCGAAGGRGGWCEAPCVGLPAGVKHLASAAVRVPTASGRVVFVLPGCEMRAGGKAAGSLDPSDNSGSAGSSTAKAPPQRLDILRGQETLVMGTLIAAVLHQQPGAVFRPERLFCLIIDETAFAASAHSEHSQPAQQAAPSRQAKQSVWISTKDGAINWFRSYRTGIACDALAPSAACVLN